jgi:hypothetical protein
MLFVFLILRQDLQDYWDYFFLDHFPEESDPTQSAFSGANDQPHSGWLVFWAISRKDKST